MDAFALRDLVARGMGKAAQKIGRPYTVFRPRGISKPLDPRNRVIQLFAAFEPENKGALRDSNPYWRGIFDTFYTQAGDYLTNRCQTFFVASQIENLPAQCVLVNRTITVTRSSYVMQGGYSGFSTANPEVVLDGWPGLLLAGHGRLEPVEAHDPTLGSWTMFLPPSLVSVREDDVVNDEAGSIYAVAQAQQSILGWRLMLKQVAT